MCLFDELGNELCSVAVNRPQGSKPQNLSKNCKGGLQGGIDPVTANPRPCPLRKQNACWTALCLAAGLQGTAGRAAMLVVQVLHVLCGVAEYDELPVRHNEDKLNATLAGEVRWPTDSRSADDPHTKANLLLQVLHTLPSPPPPPACLPVCGPLCILPQRQETCVSNVDNVSGKLSGYQLTCSVA